MQGTRLIHSYIHDTISAFSDDTNFFMIGCWFFVFLTSIVELSNYFVWYWKAKRIAQTEGRFVETKSRKLFQKWALILLGIVTVGVFISMGKRFDSIFAWISIGYCVLLFGIVFGVKALLKKCSVSTKINRNVTLLTCVFASIFATLLMTVLVFKNVDVLIEKRHEPIRTYEYNGWVYEAYQDHLPLYLEDFVDIGEEEYSYKKEEEESLFLRQISGSQRKLHFEGEAAEMSYDIVEIKAAFLYDVCLKDFLNEPERIHDTSEYREIQEASWGAEKVYRLYDKGEYFNTYLVCYRDKIVRIRFYDLEIDTNLIKIIAEKLKPI